MPVRLLGRGLLAARFKPNRVLGLESLFANGENGLLTGPFSELTRLFITQYGPPQVSADNDPVGLLLDRSKWGGKTLNEVMAEQPNLITGVWTNASTAPSTVSSSSDGGTITFTGNGAFAARARLVLATEPGARYILTGIKAGARTVSAYSGDQPLNNTANINGEGLDGSLSFIASTSSTYIQLAVFFAEVAVVTLSGVTFKKVPGNHPQQSNSAQRPSYRTNIGKPAIQHDGADDRHMTSLFPTQAGTVAVAFRHNTAIVSHVIAAGGTGTDKRLRIIMATTGFMYVNWGTIANQGGVPSRIGVDTVALLTWGDDGIADWWVDGVKIATFPNAVVFDGTGTPFAIGGQENAVTAILSGFRYGEVILNRKVTSAEVALITADLQSRMPTYGPNLVTNGDFADAGNTVFYVHPNNYGTSSLAVSGGQLVFTRGSSDWSEVRLQVPVTIGDTLRVQFDATVTSTARLIMNQDGGASGPIDVAIATGKVDHSITALSTGMVYICLKHSPGVTAATITIDNLVVRKRTDPVYGPDLLAARTGDFSNDTDWSKLGATSITGGVGVKDNNGADGGFQQYNFGLVVGRTYRVIYTLTALTNSFQMNVGGVGDAVRNGPGTFSYELVAASSGVVFNGMYAYFGSTAFGSIDNVIIQERLS